MKAVKFLPFVGKEYYNGINGKRIMILGHNHYCAKLEDATEDITNRVFQDLLNENGEHEYYKNTYSKFINSLAGKKLDKKEQSTFWNKVLFYNYVQEAMPSWDTLPNKRQYLEAETPFFEVLEEYKPDIIFVWGSSTYNNLPKKGSQLEDLSLDTGEEFELWSYTTKNGHISKVLKITHPSSAYASAYWNLIMNKLINE